MELDRRTGLRMQESLLRIAGRLARIGGWRIELPSRVLFWSDEVCDLHGRAAGHTPSLDEALLFFPGDDRALVTQCIDACAADGRPFDVNVHLSVATGQILLVRLIGAAVTDPHGRVIAVEGAMQDVAGVKEAPSVQKQTAMALREINRALTLLTKTNKALVRSDTEHDLLEAVCRIAWEVGEFKFVWIGYALDDDEKSVVPQAQAGNASGYLSNIRISWSADSPMGGGPAGRVIRSGEALLVPDIAADRGFAPWLQVAQEHGIRGTVALPLKDRTRTFGVLGLYFADECTMSAEELRLFGELAEDVAFGIGTLRARVEQRRAAAQLKQQAALLDAAQDAILVRDLHGVITFWNRSAEQLYGWTAAEAVGTSVLDLVYRDPASYRQAIGEVIRTGTWTGEITHYTRDGRELAIEGRWTLVRDDSGAPSAILAVNTNVTERKRLEAQFFRTQRLESIGTLASGIAHDLNNVLAPIIMGTELIRQLDSSDRVRLVLESIERSASRGTNLVRQVLAFARGVEGQRATLHPRDTVREIESIVHNTFPKNIIPSVDIDPAEWTIVGDTTQLSQVVLNLCVNARDAMPDGGRLTISTRNEVIDAQYAAMYPGATPGRYVIIDVADTGAGIPRDILDRIFEPFFTTKDLRTGTGLGLSTVLGIVRSHGGFVAVRSEVGEGSVFSIALPAGRESTAVAPEFVPSEPVANGHGETILVVDDEPSILTVMTQTLETYGYQVMVAEDGVQAIALYARHRDRIALVITDMMMPGMDGPALATALKRIDPGVRIIAASGLNSSANVARAEAAGVTEFLTKPYSADMLLRKLSELLKGDG